MGPYNSALVAAPAAIAARLVNWKIDKIYYTSRVKKRRNRQIQMNKSYLLRRDVNVAAIKHAAIDES